MSDSERSNDKDKGAFTYKTELKNKKSDMTKKWILTLYTTG